MQYEITMWAVVEESFEFPEVLGEFASLKEALAFRDSYLAANDEIFSDWVYVVRV